MTFHRYCLWLLAAMFLPAWTIQTKGDLTVPLSQPANERAAQEKLPQAAGGMWKLLATTTFVPVMDQGYYHAEFPDAVKKLDGQTVTVGGFMVPLDATEKFNHFLLTKRTPTCPYCPPGEPNEIVEVYTAKPISYTESLASFEGQMTLQNDNEAGIFFKMTDARPVAAASKTP